MRALRMFLHGASAGGMLALCQCTTSTSGSAVSTPPEIELANLPALAVTGHWDGLAVLTCDGAPGCVEPAHAELVVERASIDDPAVARIDLATYPVRITALTEGTTTLHVTMLSGDLRREIDRPVVVRTPNRVTFAGPPGCAEQNPILVGTKTPLSVSAALFRDAEQLSGDPDPLPMTVTGTLGSLPRTRMVHGSFSIDAQSPANGEVQSSFDSNDRLALEVIDASSIASLEVIAPTSAPRLSGTVLVGRLRSMTFEVNPLAADNRKPCRERFERTVTVDTMGMCEAKVSNAAVVVTAKENGKCTFTTHVGTASTPTTIEIRDM